MFAIGDRVAGISNMYGITNKDMYEAVVVDTNNINEMRVRVLKHKDFNCYLQEHWVANDEKYFRLIQIKDLEPESDEALVDFIFS